MNPIAITELLIPTLDDHDMNKQDDKTASTNSRHDTSGDHRRSVSCTRIHLKPRPYQHGSGASGALLATTDFIVEPEEGKKLNNTIERGVILVDQHHHILILHDLLLQKVISARLPIIVSSTLRKRPEIKFIGRLPHSTSTGQTRLSFEYKTNKRMPDVLN
jgi:hypothetical protein